VPKALDILKHFPSFHHTDNKRKLLYKVVAAIATPLEEMERQTIDVLRAHWVDTAEELDDLRKIASLYNIYCEDGESIEKFRERLKKTVALYLEGPGTARSLFEFSVLALKRYGIDIERDNRGKASIEQKVGGDAFRSRVKVKGNAEYLEIKENPLKDKEYINRKIISGESWFLTNRDFNPVLPTIVITGVGERTINPLIINYTGKQVIGFRGVVPDGQELVFYPDGKAELNGAMSSTAYSLEKVSFFDMAMFDDIATVFPFCEPSVTFNNIYFAEGTEAPRFDQTTRLTMPALPVGQSEWCFRIEGAFFNISLHDRAAYIIPEQGGCLFDQDVFDNAFFVLQASAALAMYGKERKRASFELSIPARLGTEEIAAAPPDADKTEAYLKPLKRVQKVIDRVKAGGIEGKVGYDGEGWTLGLSILRSEGAEEPSENYLKTEI
jgi:hypothetical protein